MLLRGAVRARLSPASPMNWHPIFEILGLAIEGFSRSPEPDLRSAFESQTLRRELSFYHKMIYTRSKGSHTPLSV
jgi:hypothetical protein